MLGTMKSTMIITAVTKNKLSATNQMKLTLSINRLPSLKADHHDIHLMIAL